ncbi:hypothetical protein EDD86DRAFT_204419 [Gorgonomyces haynaldii]|nr:hypothetical protein EDD86DRAFT_204419 [Gorgonomyces haynaldii]
MDKKTQRYDRQLRLWQQHGQHALETASILLLGATAAGAETLKNLILPGIGRYTVADHQNTTLGDVGSNFFLSVDQVGKNRAQSLVELLSELNEEAKGQAVVRDPHDIIQNDPSFVQQHSLVIASHLSEPDLLLLESICRKSNTKLVIAFAYGFFGYLRLVGGVHHVLETHPDQIFDFRLDKPWSGLLEHIKSFDFEKMDAMQYSHTPFVVLLLKAIEKWKSNHSGMPSNRQEKEQMKQLIRETAHKDILDDENVREALANIGRAYSPSKPSSGLLAVLSRPEVEQTEPFWRLCKALKQFIEKYGELPLAGVLPDMKADTDSFVALQTVYRQKAQEDITKLKQLIQGNAIPDEDIQRFCKNCSLLQVIDYNSLENEYKQTQISQDELSESVFYFLFRSCNKFRQEHGRWPGDASEWEQDIPKVQQIFENLLKSFGLDPSGFEDQVHEIVRCGGAELHNIASIIGGMASQEIIKLITHQYVPTDNTVIFNGVSSTTAVIKP